MASIPPSPNGRSKFAVEFLKIASGPILALIVLYTGIIATKSTKEQQLVDLQNQVMELQEQVEKNRELLVNNKDVYAKKTELKDAIDGQTRVLEEIQKNVREIRNR